jgi:hypothetical protein
MLFVLHTTFVHLQWLYDHDYNSFRNLMGTLPHWLATYICRTLGVDY